MPGPFARSLMDPQSEACQCLALHGETIQSQAGALLDAALGQSPSANPDAKVVAEWALD